MAVIILLLVGSVPLLWNNDGYLPRQLHFKFNLGLRKIQRDEKLRVRKSNSCATRRASMAEPRDDQHKLSHATISNSWATRRSATAEPRDDQQQLSHATNNNSWDTRRSMTAAPHHARRHLSNTSLRNSCATHRASIMAEPHDQHKLSHATISSRRKCKKVVEW